MGVFGDVCVPVCVCEGVCGKSVYCSGQKLQPKAVKLEFIMGFEGESRAKRQRGRESTLPSPSRPFCSAWLLAGMQEQLADCLTCCCCCTSPFEPLPPAAAAADDDARCTLHVAAALPDAQHADKNEHVEMIT